MLLLEVQENSPAARASLLPGDILLGTDEGAFHAARDLSRALAGRGPRLLRCEFLRGDYRNVRRVTLALGGKFWGNGIAA